MSKTMTRVMKRLLALQILLAALLSMPLAYAQTSSSLTEFPPQGRMPLADPENRENQEAGANAAVYCAGRQTPVEMPFTALIAQGVPARPGAATRMDATTSRVADEGGDASPAPRKDISVSASSVRRMRAAAIGCGSVIALLTAALTLLLVRARRRGKRLDALNREIASVNALLKTFIDAQGDLAYMKDEKLRYVFVNSSLVKYCERSEAEIIGADDHALTDRAMAEARRDADLAVLATGQTLRHDLLFRGRIMQVTKFPVPLAGGKLGVGAYVRDVTDERRAERRREMTSRRLSILFAVAARPFQSAREQISTLLPEILSLTGSKYCFVRVPGGAGEAYTLSAPEGVGDRLMPDEFWDIVAENPGPLIVNDFSRSPLAQKHPQDAITITRFIATAIPVGGRTVAAVALANKADDYEENDAYELTLLMTGVWNDIERRKALAKLAHERARSLQTLYSIGDGVMVVDAEGRVEILNTVAETLTGYASADAAGRYYREVFRVHGAQGDPIATALSTRAVCAIGKGAILLARDGAEHSVEDSAAPIRDENGNVTGAVVVFRDVTEKIAEARRIEYQNAHDPLTGLYNRGFMNGALAQMDTPDNLPLSVLMGDLNGLKLTNDIFGHASGDDLLRRIAEVIARSIRERDVAARMGGDEFMILLPGTDAAEAERLMARIKADFAREKVRAIKGSISMGMACKDQPERSMAVVINTAEDAMYNAKSFDRDEAYRGTVDELIRALHTASGRERAHSLAVRDLAERTGRAMGLEEDSLRKLRDAAYLHDIGKIVLDASLLDPAHPLSEFEMNEIRRHPILGFRILNAFDDTAAIAETVLSHHERWDGTGYPRGLKGAESLLLSRVISVCGAYDRMVHTADGTPASTREQALAELRAGAGTQFDPGIIEAFVAMLAQESAPGVSKTAHTMGAS